MAKIKLGAYLRPRAMAFDSGVTSFFDLLRQLQMQGPFAPGWEVSGHNLLSHPDDASAALRTMQQSGEGFQSGVYFALAESARLSNGQPVQIEQYLAELQFDRAGDWLHFDISLLPELASVDLFIAIVKALQGFGALQHVSVEDPFYAKYDRPLDAQNRPGIGWAGWVPFTLTSAQVPQAGVLEVMGQGTFLASHRTFWDTTDRVAVKRAQALEAALNGMGLIPTFSALSAGTWGQSG